MRGAVLAAVALLACRARSRRPPEPEDVVAVTDRSTPYDRAEVATEDAAAQGDASLEGAPRWTVRARCPLSVAVLGDDLRRRRTVQLGEVEVGPREGLALLGGGWEDCPPLAEVFGLAPARVRVGYNDGPRLGRPRDPSVAFALARGVAKVEVPAGAPSPLRIDTRVGRLIVTEGRVEVAVGSPWARGGEGAVTIQTTGATATLWRERGGAAAAEPLPGRGVRTLLPTGDALGAATRELALARSLLTDDAAEAAVMRASLALGRAEAALWERSTPELRAARDAVAQRIEAVAP